MSHNSKTINILLWLVQILLALLFVFAGGMKLVMPLAEMQQGPIVLPGAFLRFIGVAELLGGLGLVLPGLFRVHLFLVPLAAAGLVTIMAGATTLTALGMGVLPALFPMLVGTLAVIVCVGRGRVNEPARPGTARRGLLFQNR